MGTSGIRSGSGSAATLAALKCLVSTILITLSDKACAGIIPTHAHQPSSGLHTSLSPLTSSTLLNKAAVDPVTGQQQSSSQRDLNALRRMSSQHAIASSSSSSPANPATQQAASLAPKNSTVSAPRDIPSAERRLRVERSPEWILETATRVCALLKRLLPPLASHPRAAVRQALVQGASLSQTQLLSSHRFT